MCEKTVCGNKGVVVKAPTFKTSEAIATGLMLFIMIALLSLANLFGFEDNVLGFAICYALVAILGIVIGFYVGNVCSRKNFSSSETSSENC